MTEFPFDTEYVIYRNNPLPVATRKPGYLIWLGMTYPNNFHMARRVLPE